MDIYKEEKEKGRVESICIKVKKGKLLDDKSGCIQEDKVVLGGTWHREIMKIGVEITIDCVWQLYKMAFLEDWKTVVNIPLYKGR